MSFTENSVGFTPDFINFALSGLNYRFLLVLECESRPGDDLPQLDHPRFWVGGHRATHDPRNVSILELQPLDPTTIEIPTGWEKVHQLIYGASLSASDFVPHSSHLNFV
jgi:hypothetical protein